MLDTAKALLRGKFMILHVYIRKMTENQCSK